MIEVYEVIFCEGLCRKESLYQIAAVVIQEVPLLHVLYTLCYHCHKKESKTFTNQQSSSITTGNSSKSGNSKQSDIYDVYDYESAQDFADDKYEEFYDYEDDYEDEDEAYDAAEDYWNDHH